MSSKPEPNCEASDPLGAWKKSLFVFGAWLLIGISVVGCLVAVFGYPNSCLPMLSFCGMGIITGALGLIANRWPRLEWPLVVIIPLLWICWFVVMPRLFR